MWQWARLETFSLETRQVEMQVPVHSETSYSIAINDSCLGFTDASLSEVLGTTGEPLRGATSRRLSSSRAT